MATPYYSRREEVLDLTEEISEDATDLSEKVEQLRTLLTDPYSPSDSPDDFDDE